jgi:hypothetical protein
MKQMITRSAILCALVCVSGSCVKSQHNQGSGSAAAATQARTGFESPLDQMESARAMGKLSVPIDVRYRLAGVVIRDQPMPLELALVARVAGTNLKIEFPQSKSVLVESGQLTFAEQKAGAEHALRRNLRVTPRQDAANEVRVLVSMDIGGGRYFGVYTIPMDRGGLVR